MKKVDLEGWLLSKARRKYPMTTEGIYVWYRAVGRGTHSGLYVTIKYWGGGLRNGQLTVPIERVPLT